MELILSSVVLTNSTLIDEIYIELFKSFISGAMVDSWRLGQTSRVG